MRLLSILIHLVIFLILLGVLYSVWRFGFALFVAGFVFLMIMKMRV